MKKKTKKLVMVGGVAAVAGYFLFFRKKSVPVKKSPVTGNLIPDTMAVAKNLPAVIRDTATAEFFITRL